MEVKLLKDLPNLKKGEIGILEDDLRIQFATKSGFTYIYLKDVDDFGNWFEYIEDKPKRWRAEKGEPYFIITYTGQVCENYDDYMLRNEAHYEAYNYFQTEEEAQKVADRQLMQRELEEYAREVNEGWVLERDNGFQNKYYIGFEGKEFKTRVAVYGTFLSVVYFKTEALAQSAIDKFGDRLKLLLI